MRLYPISRKWPLGEEQPFQHQQPPRGQSINITDVARLSVDNITDEEMDNYLNDGACLTVCGGVSINNASFVHLKEGRLSTAKGLTL